MFAAVADEQIVRSTAATISFQPVDQDGEPVDPGATVTVSIVTAAGTAVVTDQATSGAGAAPRTFALTVEQTATVDQLTATWATSAATLGVTTIDILGGPLITLAEFQAREPKASLIHATDVRRARREVDDLFRRACRRSFVPRFEVERFQVRRSSDRLTLRYPQLERIGFATDENGLAVTGATAVSPNESGIAILDDRYWPCGEVTVGYEHGYRRPPYDVVGAAARTIRDKLNQGSSSIPDRATSWADPAGGTTRLATPGLGPFTTGIPEVDEVLVAHRWNVPGVA